MDVYLVPIGRERYELYCEVPEEPEEAMDEAPAGFGKRMRQPFSAFLAGGGRGGSVAAGILRSGAERLRERRRARFGTWPKVSPSNDFSGTCAARTPPA